MISWGLSPWNIPSRDLYDIYVMREPHLGCIDPANTNLHSLGRNYWVCDLHWRDLYGYTRSIIRPHTEHELNQETWLAGGFPLHSWLIMVNHWCLLLGLLDGGPFWPWVCIKLVWPSVEIWRHISGSTLAQVMACCLTAPSHCLNQCWLIISEVLWKISGKWRYIIYPWYEFQK